MPHLPAGDVTFMFTDIEGSTRLLDELGPDDYGAALADHRQILRAAFGRHGGTEVDTQGDAFFVAFADAREAVAAVADALRGLALTPVRVRIGLHTGRAQLAGHGYVGRDVHLGARIAAAGHGGQVLMSKATRDLVDDPVLDLGEHRVKDFADPVWIYQLGAERFPPLRTISSTNLPRPASSFVGREREVAEIRSRLLHGARMVTLTGPGGTGKTRLAIEAAAELVAEFRNGVFWVDLAALRDHTLVADSIARTLGAKDGLADHIAERQMLLVVDNLEQVIPAARDLAKLVEACPNLFLLLTSRERLRVRGEVEHAVPPLAEQEAVDLFAQRSGLARDDTVAELCRRLDNLPLAVELAAARSSVLSPAQIMERLSKRLDLLKGGRDADPRQQTLRATIEWSYDLLTPEEQLLFARLAVFRGGSTMEAAERIADADLDRLGGLVDKSLLRHVDDRFVMLETIREFAVERLEASGEADTLRHRHAEFFLALAEEAEPHLRSPAPKAWLERLGPDNDNLRVALDRLESWADADGALRLAGALDEFWCPRAEHSAGRRYLALALGIESKPTPVRAKALIAAAHLSRDDSDPAAGRAYAAEALALSRELDDEHIAGRATLWLGACVADEGDFDQAREIFEEAARLLAGVGDHLSALFATRLLAWMYYELGDRARARTLHESNLARARELGSRDLEASILGALSEYAVNDGRIADAVELSAASIRVDLEIGDPQGMATELPKCASVLVATGQVEPAVQLLASSAAWFEEAGSRPLPYLAELNEQIIESSRTQLGEAAFATAWEAGRRLTIEAAAELAAKTLEGSTTLTASPQSN